MRKTKSKPKNAPQEKAGGDCPRTPCSPLRAFRVTCVGFGDPIVHIVKHVTPQAAKFAGFMASEKAFCGLHIRQFSVVRSPEFDPAPLEKGLLYDEIRAKGILENAKVDATAEAPTKADL